MRQDRLMKFLGIYDVMEPLFTQAKTKLLRHTSLSLDGDKGQYVLSGYVNDSSSSVTIAYRDKGLLWYDRMEIVPSMTDIFNSISLTGMFTLVNHDPYAPFNYMDVRAESGESVMLPFDMTEEEEFQYSLLYEDFITSDIRNEILKRFGHWAGRRTTGRFDEKPFASYQEKLMMGLNHSFYESEVLPEWPEIQLEFLKKIYEVYGI